MSDLNIGSQSIVIGKDNINNTVIDYTVRVSFKVSKDNKDKMNGNAIDSKVDVHYKGPLGAILTRLTKGGKPVIALCSMVRKDYNAGIVPKSVYGIEYTEKAAGIVSESKALETIAESTKDLTETDRIEYLLNNKLITEDMALALMDKIDSENDIESNGIETEDEDDIPNSGDDIPEIDESEIADELETDEEYNKV